MADPKLLKKLLIKPNQRLLLLKAPPDFVESIQPLPEGAQLLTEADGRPVDGAILFVQNAAELAALAQDALSSLVEDGLLWVAYPKQSSGLETDLNRDVGWEILHRAGLRAIASISIDGTWSAVRFRPRGDETPHALVEAQYAGAKEHLRPIYQRLVEEALRLDPDIKIVPRKTYVALQKGKTFALIAASARDRVDLGLKLPAHDDTDRLLDSAGFGSGSITHKVSLHELSDVDPEVLGWLHDAYRNVT